MPWFSGEAIKIRSASTSVTLNGYIRNVCLWILQVAFQKVMNLAVNAIRHLTSLYSQHSRCASRKSYPRVAVMQACQNRHSDDGFMSLDRSTERRIFF